MTESFVVEGLACTWNRWGSPGAKGEPALSFQAGSIALDRPIALHLWHDSSKSFASTREGSLEVWQDSSGLYFRAEMFPTRKSLWIVNQIRGGNLRGVSVGMADNCRVVDRDQGEEVVSGSLREISFAPNPRQPGTSCWSIDELSHELPVDVIAAKRRFLASSQSVLSINAHAARPPASVLAKVDALLALPRPAAAS